MAKAAPTRGVAQPAASAAGGHAWLAALGGLWPRAPLHAGRGRARCGGCGASREHYCYDCAAVLPAARAVVPGVRLPLRVDVVKDPREHNGKSTAVQARVLAPEDVALHVFPAAPAGLDAARTLLLFPDSTAAPLAAVDLLSFDRVVFLDGTWQQARSMLRRAPALQALRRVRIDAQQTLYWRPQHGRSTADLATVEAIYFFLRSFLELRDGAYAGQVDNLLFFFAYHYELVHRVVPRPLAPAAASADAEGADAEGVDAEGVDAYAAAAGTESSTRDEEPPWDSEAPPEKRPR
jgi:hypothetical protein